MPVLMSSAATFMGLPPDIRVKIYGVLFKTLIADLPDNLFGVFSVFDETYDITRDFKKKCRPSYLRLQCPLQPISTWLCGHHRAGWLALDGPPSVPRKLFTYYEFDPETVLIQVNPRFKTWAKKDKEFWASIFAGEIPSRSGITSILLVCRLIYVEAVDVLYEHAEIVVNLHSSHDDLGIRSNLEGKSLYPHFEGVQLAPVMFARRLKLNIWFDDKRLGTSDKITQRLERLLSVLNGCSRVDSLEIFIDDGCIDDSGHFVRVTEVLKARLLPRAQKRMRPALVSLGKVNMNDYSSEKFNSFLKAVHG